MRRFVVALAVALAGLSAVPAPRASAAVTLPLLSGSVTTSAPTGPQDLTTIGATDWAVWGYGAGGTSTSLAPDVRKSGGAAISDLTDIEQAPAIPLRGLGQWPGTFTFGWSDGSTVQTATAASSGLQHNGADHQSTVGYGFSLTVPAIPTPQQLILFVTAHGGSGRLEASLGNGTATVARWVNTSVGGGGLNRPGVYTVNFAGTVGETLTVRWTLDAIIGTSLDAEFANVAIFAAALSPAPIPTGVRAHGFAVSPATFYPLATGYRQTTAIKGVLDEAASVAISVYAPTGKKVRSFALGTRTGSYAVTWNGRSSSGTLQPAGRYRVVQTIHSSWGNTRTSTSYVTLSLKRLYWYTSSQTRLAGAFDSADRTAFGVVSTVLSRYAGGVWLSGNINDQWAAAYYFFTLPSAAAYKNLKFSVLGSSMPGYGPGHVILHNVGAQRFGVQALAGPSYAWYSTPATSDPSYIDHRTVMGIVDARGTNMGSFYAAQVRLTYSYGILR